MKKKKLLSLLLALSLCTGLFAIPAGAYYIKYSTLDGHPYFATTQDNYDWWSANSSYLMNELNLTTPHNTSIATPVEFQDGFIIRSLLGSGLPIMPFRYVDRDCNVYDLGQGRYWQMYSFSEGLAAALKDISKNPAAAQSETQICYIDKQGNEVFSLDPSFCAVKNIDRHYVGYFQNGKACVVRSARKDLNFHGVLDLWNCVDYGIEYAYIDTSGKVVTDWTYTKDKETIIHLPLYMSDAAWIGHCVSDSPYLRNAPLYAGQAPEAEVPFKASHPDGTYGQAQVDFLGYTIDPDNLYNGRGDIVVQVTNATPNWDEGDLFHLLYSRYSETGPIVNNTTEFLPCGDIRQIHYEIEPWGVKILKIPTDYVVNEDKKLLWAGFLDMNPHWTENPYVDESRTLFLQAETYAECTRLVEFFKAAHDYGEMQLTYEAHNGVTILGAPMPILQRKAYLDQELAAFTSQF